MNTAIHFTRKLATAILGGTLILVPVAAFSYDGPPSPNTQRMHERFEHHKHEKIAHSLDRMADRLQIKASQEAAWKRYESTVQSLAESRHPRPSRNADAAAMLHFKADRLAEMSHKLNRLADATGDLEKVLTPEQREVLKQIAQHRSLHGHRGRGHQGHGR